VLHVDIGVSGALGFDVADSGKSVAKAETGRTRSQDRAEGLRLFEQLDVIVGGGDVALKKHVGVGINEARQAGFGRQVDGASGSGPSGGDSRNALAL